MDTRAVIQSALDYIESNLCTPLLTQELADRAGLSLYHFHRLFRGVVGTPVQEYIRRRRLLHAAYAIRCGQKRIDAAYQYGFSTYSGFYRAFVREFGCTPTEYLLAGHAVKPRRTDLYREVYIPMNAQLAAAVLKNWQLDALPLSDVFYESTGERNEHAVYVGKDYVLKFSADKKKLLRHVQLSAALSQQGLLAAVPIPTTSGESIVRHGRGWYFLSSRLPGNPLHAQDFLTQDGSALAHAFGANLGRLHAALSGIDLAVDEAALPTESLAWSLPRVRDVLPLPAGLVHRMTEVLTQLSPSLPCQILHRDPNPSNVLVSSEGWSFIDFELSQRGIRLYDVCYAATAVLSEVFRSGDAQLLCAWPAFYRALLRGYDNTAHLTAEEKEALPYMLLAEQFRCLAWFAEQPQYPDIFAANKRMTAWLLERRDDLAYPED